MQGKVSMVVPCYNKEKYIGAMLESVVAQEWDNIEVILVNDGSTDDTRDVISAYEPKLKARGYEVVIIDQENAGCCAAVYAGLIRMTGDYFCLVDCDDEIMPQYVSRMAWWLDNHNDYEWAACNYKRVIIGEDDSEVEEPWQAVTRQDTPKLLENYILRRVITMTWIYMMRVSYVKKCGLIEVFCAERRVTYEPCIIVPPAAAGGRLKFFNEQLYKYNVFASDLFKFSVYEDAVKFYGDYLYLYEWTINRLDMSNSDKLHYINLARLTHKFQLGNYLNLPNGDNYRQALAQEFSSVLDEVFTPPPQINVDRILDLGIVKVFQDAQNAIVNNTRMVTSMKFVIFGAGGTGLQTFARFSNEYDIVCFCDNNAKKQGQKYCKLPVIAPEEIIGRDLKVIIPPSPTHFEKAQQLFNMGIKEFYLVNPDNKCQIAHIDLTPYDDITPNSKRVCAVEVSGIGSSARALKKYNPYNDIDIVTVEHGIFEPMNFYRNGNNYYSLITSALFITQANEYVNGKKCIELWHGFTIKALWKGTFSSHERASFEFINSRLCDETVVIGSYSRLYTIMFGFCTEVPQEKFRITGMPRNDLLLRSDAKSNIRKIFGNFPQKRVVFYLPTHRDYYDFEITNDQVNGHAFFWLDFDYDDFNNFLKAHDILLIVKFHAYEIKRFAAKETANIKSIYDEAMIENDLSLYEILGASDLLITDYSSVSVDYLLLDRPIICAARDIDEYAATRGLMTEPLDAWMPGDTVQDYESLKSAIHSALFDKDKYKDKREQMRRIMHKYHDGESSRRVLDLARNIMREEYL